MKKINLLLIPVLFCLIFFTSCETLADLFGFSSPSQQGNANNSVERNLKPVVAITTFEAKEISENDTEFLMNVFTVSFVKLGVAKVVDRKHFDKIKEEQSFQISDWADKNKVAELGASLGASQLVVGNIFKRGANFFLNVKILDVNTTAIIASHFDKVRSIDDFFEKMPEFCNRLVGKKADVSSSSSTRDRNKEIEQKYKIGDAGPGGGIVFYVDREGFSVYDGMGGATLCHYLEMSRDSLGESMWYPEYSTIGSTQTGLGYGKSNTYNILNADIYAVLVLNEKNCAAYRCALYYTASTKAGEWWLPSKDELDLMYKNAKESVLASCNSSSHWSSTEYNKYYVCNQDFENGQHYEGENFYSSSRKDYTRNSVRAVRAF